MRTFHSRLQQLAERSMQQGAGPGITLGRTHSYAERFAGGGRGRLPCSAHGPFAGPAAVALCIVPCVRVQGSRQGGFQT